MCFSAEASFVASTVLIPLGLYTLGCAWRHDRRYLALATFPLLFGVQQMIEGGLWLAMQGQAALSAHTATLGFLFFAYFLWPLLVPVAALLVERDRRRRYLFVLFAIVGGIFGASLYLPLLLYADWMAVKIVQGSILYQPVLIYDGFLPRTAVRVAYALIVAVPLLFTTVHTIRTFGLLVLASVIGSAVFFAYAFVSIWCFIAAILSFFVLHVVRGTAVVESSKNGIQQVDVAEPS